MNIFLRTLFAAPLVLAAAGCVPDSRQMSVAPPQPLYFDERGAAERLAGALRFETTWSQNAVPTRAAFLDLHAYLERSFPGVHARLERTIVNELSLVYVWPGSDPSLDAALFLGHLDVVPVDDAGEWRHPPFAGDIDDGAVHGRGALDVKEGVTAMLEAAEMLLRRGFQPRRTIILAFGHDEEIMGTRGAEYIAAWLAKRGVHAGLVLDEGPAVSGGLIPGLERPVALVGLAAKGQAYFTATVCGAGGHSSIPPREPATAVLVNALHRLHEHEFERRLPQPVEQTLRYVAPEIRGAMARVYAHPRLFARPIVSALARDPKTRAVIQNTAVTTILRAGDKDATVPECAAAVIAVGIMPGESVASVRADLRAILDDDRVTLDVVRFPDNGRPHAYEPTPAAPTDGRAFAAIRRSIHQTFPDAVVAPTLMPGGSDGKHYVAAGVADAVYHFLPVDIPASLLDRMHGRDEYLPIASYANAVRFYARLMMNVQPGADDDSGSDFPTRRPVLHNRSGFR